MNIMHFAAGIVTLALLIYLFAALLVPGADAEQTAREYTAAVVAFNCAGFLLLYLLQRAQAALPLNPQGLGAVTPDLS